MSSSPDYTLFVAIDTSKLQQQTKQLEQMFNNASKKLSGSALGSIGSNGNSVINKMLGVQEDIANSQHKLLNAVQTNLNSKSIDVLTREIKALNININNVNSGISSSSTSVNRDSNDENKRVQQHQQQLQRQPMTATQKSLTKPPPPVVTQIIERYKKIEKLTDAIDTGSKSKKVLPASSNGAPITLPSDLGSAIGIKFAREIEMKIGKLNTNISTGSNNNTKRVLPTGVTNESPLAETMPKQTTIPIGVQFDNVSNQIKELNMKIGKLNSGVSTGTGNKRAVPLAGGSPLSETQAREQQPANTSIGVTFGEKKPSGLFGSISSLFEKLPTMLSKATGLGGGGGGMIGQLMGSLSKSSMAMVGVGAGIGALVAMITESSPILKSVLRLMNTGVMMMLRPIGDFVGSLLRPIMVMMLQKFIIPYYQYVDPFMRKMGGQVGGAVAKFFTDPLGALKGLADIGVFGVIGIGVSKLADWVNGGGIEKMKLNFETAWNNVKSFFDGVGSDISGGVQGAWNSLTSFFTGAGGVVSNLQSAWNTVSKFFSDAGNAITSGLSTAWISISTFFTNAGNTISSGLNSAWNSISYFFTNAGLAITTSLSSAWTSVSTFFSNAGSDITKSVQSGWNTISNFFTTAGQVIDSAAQGAWAKVATFFINAGQTIDTSLKTVWGTITGFFTDISSGLKSFVDDLKKIPLIGNLLPTAYQQQPQQQILATTIVGNPGTANGINPAAIAAVYGSAAGQLAQQFASSTFSAPHTNVGTSGVNYSTNTIQGSGGSEYAGQSFQFGSFKVKFANGGVIKEPSAIIGLKTGGVGLMAENGPEAIVPRGIGVGGGNNNVNINISINITIQGNADSTIIKRAIQEATPQIVSAVKQSLRGTNVRSGLI